MPGGWGPRGAAVPCPRGRAASLGSPRSPPPSGRRPLAALPAPALPAALRGGTGPAPSFGPRGFREPGAPGRCGMCR